MRRRVGRANSGFCLAVLMNKAAVRREELRLKFINAARLASRVKSLPRRETHWRATDIDGA